MSLSSSYQELQNPLVDGNDDQDDLDICLTRAGGTARSYLAQVRHEDGHRGPRNISTDESTLGRSRHGSISAAETNLISKGAAADSAAVAAGKDPTKKSR